MFGSINQWRRIRIQTRRFLFDPFKLGFKALTGHEKTCSKSTSIIMKPSPLNKVRKTIYVFVERGYMDVYGSIWRYIRIYEPTCSTLFLFRLIECPLVRRWYLFSLFGGPLVRHCFVSLFGSPFFRLCCVSAFLRVYRPREVSHFCLMKFHVECRQNHVWGYIFDPSYDHIYKTNTFL